MMMMMVVMVVMMNGGEGDDAVITVLYEGGPMGRGWSGLLWWSALCSGLLWSALR
jgi:hypothetical protein